jgi:polysaccharide chain length determinant protein (PEP-CTERM system associated)
MEPTAMTLNDYLAIVKRRKWSFILPAVFIFFIAAIVAFALPSIYKSTSTILIEEQDIPAEFVMSSVTSYAEQRLQSIHQRIISFTKLLDMINRFNLYPDLKKRWTTEEIVEKMREDIVLEPISTDVVDRRTGRPTAATIAFTLSYEGKNPQIVQRISNTLTTLFLEENLQVREKQATETSEFLENELEKVKESLAKLEAKMAVFKEAHMNELPELLQVNMQSLNNVESNMERLSEQLRSMKEREGYLQTQMANVPREDENRDKMRLDELKVQLVSLQARYSDQYPDVKKTRVEITELEKRLDNKNPASVKAGDLPDNPVYITLAAQLSSTQAEIVSIKRQIQEANKFAGVYRQRIVNTPKVEEAYKAILIERDNTQEKYNDLMRKHMEARVAQGLEKEQKGERFTLIDPARLPEKPDKPNRLAIMLIGIVLSIGAGVGWASFREFTDPSIRNSESLVTATSFPVLASIPEIITEEDLQRKQKKRITIIVALVVCMVTGLIVFHFLVMDLNVFWAKLMRKVGI